MIKLIVGMGEILAFLALVVLAGALVWMGVGLADKFRARRMIRRMTQHTRKPNGGT